MVMPRINQSNKKIKTIWRRKTAIPKSRNNLKEEYRNSIRLVIQDSWRKYCQGNRSPMKISKIIIRIGKREDILGKRIQDITSYRILKGK